MAYDGTIRIDTQIDERGFAEGMNTLQTLAAKAVGDIAGKVAEANAALGDAGAGVAAAGTLFEDVFEAIRQGADFTDVLAGFGVLQQGMDEMTAGIGDGAGLEEQGRLLVQHLLDGMETALPQLGGLGDRAVGAFAAALTENAFGLEGTAVELMGGLARGMEGQLRQLRVPGEGAVTEVCGGIEGKLGMLSDAAGEMVGTMTRDMAGQAGSVAEAGRDVVRGIWEGVSSMTQWLSGNFTGFLGGILDGAKSFLGIASPSKLFRDEIGKMLPEGISVGFEAAMPKAAGDMRSQLGQFVAQAQAVVMAGNLTGGLVGSQPQPVTVAPGSAGNTYYYSQEIHTAEALSPYELTREFENMKAREGWVIP